VLKISYVKLTFLNLCTVAPNPIRAEPMSPACSSKATHAVNIIFSKLTLPFKGDTRRYQAHNGVQCPMTLFYFILDTSCDLWQCMKRVDFCIVCQQAYALQPQFHLPQKASSLSQVIYVLIILPFQTLRVHTRGGRCCLWMPFFNIGHWLHLQCFAASPDCDRFMLTWLCEEVPNRGLLSLQKRRERLVRCQKKVGNVWHDAVDFTLALAPSSDRLNAAVWEPEGSASTTRKDHSKAKKSWFRSLLLLQQTWLDLLRHM